MVLHGQGEQTVKNKRILSDLYIISMYRFHLDFVGATSGRPLFIRFADETKNVFPQKKNVCFCADVYS